MIIKCSVNLWPLWVILIMKFRKQEYYLIQGGLTYPKKEIVPGTHLPNLVIKFPKKEILQ